MSFEEEFDSIIRRKSEELEFPFDEKNWDKASALLDAERTAGGAKAGFKRFLMPSLIAGIVLVSGIAVFLSTSAPAVTAEKNTEVGQAVNALSANATALQTSETVGTPANAASGLTQQHASQNTVTEPANASAATVSEASSNSISSENTVAAASPKQNTSNSIKGNAGKTPAMADTKANNAMPSVTGIGKADSPLAVNGNTTNDGAGKTTKALMPAKQADSKHNTTNADETRTPAEPAVTAATPANTVPEDLTPVYLPMLVISAPAQAEPEIDAPLNDIKRYDDDYYKSGKHKFHFLDVELGGTYLLGWNTQAGKDGKGLDWFGGFNYGLYLTNKISVSAGLQAYNVKNITQAFYTNKQVDYDFGSITSNTVITSNNLYYAAVPLKFNYAPDRTSQFSLGANFGYLVSSKNTVETYQVQDNVKIHYTPVKNTNIYQNASSMNIMLTAGYKVDIIRNLSLNTEVVYGLTDIFKNTRTIKNKEQTIGLRVSLQYKLFNK